MRLTKARVENYRSIVDSGEFEIEELKTILVGPNEAGKTVLLKALQQLNKPKDVEGFDVLRDYPRSKYNDITTGKTDPEKTTVVTGYFELEEEEKEMIPESFHKCQYKLYRNLNNKAYHTLIDAPDKITFGVLKKKFSRMISHLDKQVEPVKDGEESITPSDSFKKITLNWSDSKIIDTDSAELLKDWLDTNYEFVEEENEKEEARHAELLELIQANSKHDEVLKILDQRTPVFILFNNYFKVKPSIHLDH